MHEYIILLFISLFHSRSVHAHIALWVHEEDKDAASRKIVSMMPAERSTDPEFRSTGGWIPPNHGKTDLSTTEKLHRDLFNFTNRRQRHICGDMGEGRHGENKYSCRSRFDPTLPPCKNPKYCKMGFKQPIHTDLKPVYSDERRRYNYYCPCEGHENIVPYCPEVALVWNAHHNVQIVCQTAWSGYLLKYATKCEPHGNLNIDPEMVAKLGIPNITKQQCKLASALWMTKPVHPSEAALIMLKIPLVTQSRKVEIISTVPALSRTRKVKYGSSALKPIDLYCCRPADFKDMACR